MDSKLRKHYEEILWALDKALQEIEEISGEYELAIDPSNFVVRSPVTKAASHLMKTLKDESQDIEFRLLAAEGLIKLNRYPEQVLNFLILEAQETIQGLPENDKKHELQKLWLEALGNTQNFLRTNGAFFECPQGFHIDDETGNCVAIP